ncbi:MAG: J domain-containing protein [Pseudomonadota bacterium]
MSEPQIEIASPVDWPVGRPKARFRTEAKWRQDGRRLNFDQALRRLREQVGLVTKYGQDWRMRELTLSTNYQLRSDGRPRRDRGQPSDPSVAFFFELDGEPHLLACDRWDTVADNVAAIAAHIEALRGQERWGVATMKQAFAGHLALPAPEQWWQVLGVSSSANDEEIDKAFRAKIKEAHPDRGGSEQDAARLSWAREEGKKR